MTAQPTDVAPNPQHPVACDSYRHEGDRRGYALGVYFTVPQCVCGADRDDHDA